MELTEQNISGVKLEKLRQDVKKKSRILRKLPFFLFFLFAAAAVIKHLDLFPYISEYGLNSSVTMGAFFGMLGGLMMAVVLTGTIFCFYYMLVWKKAYDRFNFSFKNKYVLDTIRQLPGFSDLRYNASGGISYQEMEQLNLIPRGQSVFFESSDELTGILDGVPFKASNVRTGKRTSSRSSTPEILFEGQILIFSSFHDQKISKGVVQVFSKKVLSKIKNDAVPLKIQTENSVFNENFAIFAENEQNAFYILTPKMLEQIIKFQESAKGQIYLTFSEKELYVSCSQFHNPFNAYIDISVEEQCRQIIKDTSILRSARTLLIQAAEHKANI